MRQLQYRVTLKGLQCRMQRIIASAISLWLKPKGRGPDSLQECSGM